MLRPHPLAHLLQQLLPKLLLAQTPTAPNRLELLAFLQPAPFLYISISRTDPFSDRAFDRSVPFPTGSEDRLNVLLLHRRASPHRIGGGVGSHVARLRNGLEPPVATCLDTRACPRLGVEVREPLQVVLGVKQECQSDLATVAGATDGVGTYLGSGQRGQEHAGENRDDGDDHQQFDKGEGPEYVVAGSPGQIGAEGPYGPTGRQVGLHHEKVGHCLLGWEGTPCVSGIGQFAQQFGPSRLAPLLRLLLWRARGGAVSAPGLVSFMPIFRWFRQDISVDEFRPPFRILSGVIYF